MKQQHGSIGNHETQNLDLQHLWKKAVTMVCTYNPSIGEDRKAGGSFKSTVQQVYERPCLRIKMERRGAQYQPLAATWSGNPMYTLGGAGRGGARKEIELEKRKKQYPNTCLIFESRSEVERSVRRLQLRSDSALTLLIHHERLFRTGSAAHCGEEREDEFHYRSKSDVHGNTWHEPA